MRTFNFYIILTGENQKTKIRTKKLVSELNKLNEKNLENTKIIISGKSSFDFFNVDYKTSNDIQNYISKHSNFKNKKNIIRELESLDTYGNIYFSMRILIKEILILKKDFNIFKINFITEKFHTKRVKIILNHFKDLFNKLSFKCDFNLISSKNEYGIFKRYEYKITSFTNILDGFFLNMENKFLYNFKNYEIFELYLFSLPPYSYFYILIGEENIEKNDFILKHNSYKLLINLTCGIKLENQKNKVYKKIYLHPIKKLLKNINLDNLHRK